ncbi:hypothetical protein ACJJIW_18640 [Microbulbifer sp. JMSA004]|uniref:hypothetical protein n=1 Tax=Microbulbifer sp. JMSA004 TaxID=3243370 RepID=UPI00403A7113
MKDNISDIILRRIDSLINPKIENRVIYGALISGFSLILMPKLLFILNGISISSSNFTIGYESIESVENTTLFLGFFLILVSGFLLYLFKFHKRPELIFSSDSVSARSWRKCPYSFRNDQLISPLIIKDLIGWISDSKRQIVSVDIDGSNRSNRYYGDIRVRELEDRTFVEVEGEDGQGVFGYEYLGTSESGVHALHTYDDASGSGTFHSLILVVIEDADLLEYDDEAPQLLSTPVVRLIGRLSLGDRYIGNVSFNRGVLRISKDKSFTRNSLMDTSKVILVK